MATENMTCERCNKVIEKREVTGTKGNTWTYYVAPVDTHEPYVCWSSGFQWSMHRPAVTA